jgi:hypothetical protein
MWRQSAASNTLLGSRSAALSKGSKRLWDDAGGVGIDVGLGEVICANALM